MTFAKASALREGDEVAVVAPGGPFDRESFDRGVEVIAKRYKPRFDDGIYASTRYLAGSDARRLQELNAALADPSIKAIFAARGGYGTTRLLPGIQLGATPKAIIGFSDITALHALANARGWMSIHGPVLTQLGKQPPDVAARVFDLLENPAPTKPLVGHGLVDGAVEGPLLGGNLAVFTRLLGTPYLPKLDGAVLLIEDVGERPYRLDRMWTHLRLTGVFERIAGIALGDFVNCEERDADYTATQVVSDLVRETKLPCAHGFRIGHGEINQAVPLGARVRLDGTRGRLEFLEGAVE